MLPILNFTTFLDYEKSLLQSNVDLNRFPIETIIKPEGKKKKEKKEAQLYIFN